MLVVEPFAHGAFEFFLGDQAGCIANDRVVLVFEPPALLALSLEHRVLVQEQLLFEIVVCHLCLTLQYSVGFRQFLLLVLHQKHLLVDRPVGVLA